MRMLLIVIMLTVAATLCGPAAALRADDESIAKGVAAAETWLALIDRGDYDESWETAAALFRKAIRKEEWKGKILAAREPLGKRVFRKVIFTWYETSLPQAPPGEYVVVQFKTVFENEPYTVETVTPMKDPDGEWRVSGYYIK